MKSDPIIDEVRRIRCNISRQFDNDPKKLAAHYMAIQNKRYFSSEKLQLSDLPFTKISTDHRLSEGKL